MIPEFNPVPALSDDDIVTKRVLERRLFLARTGVVLLGAAAIIAGTRAAHADGKSANDSDAGTLADSHICDSDGRDARCDNDQRTFGDPKFSNDSDPTSNGRQKKDGNGDKNGKSKS